MRIGVDYFPELLSQEDWKKDAELMTKTGVKAIRIGMNSWSKIESSENNFNFDLFDEAIQHFARYGIGTVMCISEVVPKWFGKNKEKCLTSEKYIKRITCFVNELSKHYSQNKAVIEWQIDNSKIDYQDDNNAKFIDYLQDKYDSLEQVNSAWGVITDGDEYTDWNQIGFYDNASNPAFTLEKRRFCSALNTEYLKLQSSLIRKNIPKAYISVEVNNCRNPYKELEFVDYIYFKNIINNINNSNMEFELDKLRGFKNSGFGEIIEFNYKINPERLKTNIFQAYIHGADAVFLRWHSPLSGKNLNYRGLLEHSGMLSRIFMKFSEICQINFKLENINECFVSSSVAILYSPESEFSLRYGQSVNYNTEIQRFYSLFRSYGVNVDVINSESELENYNIVIAPCLYINNKTATENIYRYVINGGTLVMTTRCGVKDENGNFMSEPLPTVFSELIGAKITDCGSVDTKNKIFITDYANQKFSCTDWFDVLKLDTAKAYATYSDGIYISSPAITLNNYCKGKAYYIGTVPDDNFYLDFVGKLMKYNGVPKLTGIPEGVEIATRTDSRDDYIVFLNKSDKSNVMNLPKALYSVIDNCGKDNVNLMPYSIDIVKL